MADPNLTSPNAFISHLQPIVVSPHIGSWDDDGEAEGAILGPEMDQLSLNAEDDDGFVQVQSRRSKHKKAAPRGNSHPKSEPSITQRPEPVGLRRKKSAPNKNKPTIVVDPRTLPPPPPDDLSADAKAVYGIIRENQPLGGCSARKIVAILDDRSISSSATSAPFDLLSVGDILYDELKVKGLVFKVGDRGGKWRILSK